MKFGELIHNMRNIFLKKSYPKCGETSPNPLLKNQNWGYRSKVLYCLFILYVQVEGYQSVLKVRCRPLAFTSKKIFEKSWRVLEIVSLSDFLHDFWWKTFLTIYSINWPNYFYFLRCWRICVLHLFFPQLVTT